MNVPNFGQNYSLAISVVVFLTLLQACSEESSVLDSSSEVAGSRDGTRASDIPSAEEIRTTLSAREHCEAVLASVKNAGFEDQAWVTCDSVQAHIHSDSYPDHDVMTGAVGTNEQIPWPAPGYSGPVSLSPAPSGTIQTRDSSMAIAVNGIPIFDYSVGGELVTEDLFYHQPHLDAMIRGEIDNCGGHTGKGDDYHYHEIPRCMIEQMDNRDENPIIGWGFDGFPLYGNTNPDGSEIAQGLLDVCNGQLDPVFGYRYHTSEEQPYILQCLVGIVDLSAAPSVGMFSPDGVRRPASPPVNVENMTFTKEPSGAARLTYDYEGESFFMAVAPTDDPNCYDHSWKVIGNEGTTEGIEGNGEFCHIVRTGAGMGAPTGMGAPQ